MTFQDQGHGCEPFVQPYIKLNAAEKRPHVRFDWTEQLLRDVARWANGFIWRKVPFSEYRRCCVTVTPDDDQMVSALKDENGGD